VTEYKCRKWVQVLGTNPQTGKEESYFDCRDHMDHFLQLEFNKRMNELGSAMESMRNGMISVLSHQAIVETEKVIEAVKAGQQLTNETPKKLLEVKDAE
jgi:hypothetical protein